jgi:hypothetical protein
VLLSAPVWPPKASTPTAVFSWPVVSASNDLPPIAVFSSPVPAPPVMFLPASYPTAVFNIIPPAKLFWSSKANAPIATEPLPISSTNHLSKYFEYLL